MKYKWINEEQADQLRKSWDVSYDEFEQGDDCYVEAFWQGKDEVLLNADTLIGGRAWAEAEAEEFLEIFEAKNEKAYDDSVSDYYGGDGPKGCYGPDDWDKTVF